MRTKNNRQHFNEMVKKLAASWIEIQAIKQGKFTLASGKTSRLYFDLRLCFGNPVSFKMSINVFDELIQNEIGWDSIDGIAGIPTAGLPFAATLAYIRKKPLYYPRKPKEHGLRRSIEGGNVEGKHVIVIDDLISTGHSKLPALKTLKDNGAAVQHVCVLLDRELGGKKVIEENGIQLHSACTFSQIKQWFNLPDP